MLKALIAVVWTFLNTVLRGYLVKTFWFWFVLPVFPHLPALTTVSAIGLSFVVSALTPIKSVTSADLVASQGEQKYDHTTMTLINAAIYTIAFLIALLSGWLLHHFFM